MSSDQDENLALIAELERVIETATKLRLTTVEYLLHMALLDVQQKIYGEDILTTTAPETGDPF